MAQKSRYLRDGLSFYDSGVMDSMWRNIPHPSLISPVIGYGRIEDFDGTWNDDGWVETLVSVGTGTSSVAPKVGVGGLVRINTAANENDGGQVQQSVGDGGTTVYEHVIFNSSTSIYFDARVNLTEEATQSDALFGFCIADTSLIAGMTDGVYWHKDDGDTDWDLTAEKDSSQTDLTGELTAVAATWAVLGFTFDGTTLTPWVNGVKSANTITLTLPDNEELALSFAYLNGAAGSQNDGMDIDWYRYLILTDRK